MKGIQRVQQWQWNDNDRDGVQNKTSESAHMKWRHCHQSDNEMNVGIVFLGFFFFFKQTITFLLIFQVWNQWLQRQWLLCAFLAPL